MKRLLTVVFAGVVASSAWGQAGAPDPARLKLRSANVLVLDAAEDRQIYAKAADEVTPIASVTKLMTAMVILDAQQALDESLDIDAAARFSDDISARRSISRRVSVVPARRRDELFFR
jgi:D-alanyl-D-alanine carboxypeptidase